MDMVQCIYSWECPNPKCRPRPDGLDQLIRGKVVSCYKCGAKRPTAGSKGAIRWICRNHADATDVPEDKRCEVLDRKSEKLASHTFSGLQDYCPTCGCAQKDCASSRDVSLLVPPPDYTEKQKALPEDEQGPDEESKRKKRRGGVKEKGPLR